ncbi:MAG: hypothetical protein GC146_06460 [Limimaricola sp.]|uniref:hypothetical protein n=1 Tax=Limimaricola sp. TaxID=2211665 RepID=UPI001DCDD9F3|nr:hypothetical protein [Limimaricola sp.]MBI1416850.1 hypothetical protein [Limimaricola sp.]
MATVSPSPRSTTITLGSTTAGPFDVGFRLFTDEVAVYVDGVLLDGAEYSVAGTFVGGYCDAATVTLNTARDAGTQVTIQSVASATRSVDYLATDPGLARKLNIELGRLTSIVADAKRDGAASLRVLDVANVVIPTDRASKYLAFDADGNVTVAAGSAGEYPVSDYMGSVVVAADAAAARTLLGLGTAAVTAASAYATAAQGALADAAAPKESPVFTGAPKAPTAAAGTDTEQIATTAFVVAQGGIKGVSTYASNLTSYDLAGDAPTGATHADIYVTGSGSSGGNVEFGRSGATVVKYNVPLSQLASVTTSLGAAVVGNGVDGSVGNASTYSDGTLSISAGGGLSTADGTTSSATGSGGDIVFRGSSYNYSPSGFWGGIGAYGSGGGTGASNYSGAGVLRVFWR